MGIKNLFDEIKKRAPDAIKIKKLKDYATQKIGYDASSFMYQYLYSMLQADKFSITTQFEDKDGNITTHLLGLFNKVTFLLENNIKPVFVFDGVPPKLKSGELAKRRQRRELAKEKLEEAKEVGTGEDVRKQARIQARITKEMKEESMKMLKMFGVEVIEAPCEAEAQLVDLLKKNLIDAVASEDMDCLTFGCKKMLKGVKTSKEPIVEISLDKVLEGFGFDMEQFINYCILCGCDYTKSIKNLGVKKAYDFIKEHKNIENVVNYIEKLEDKPDKKRKFIIPEELDFKYKEAFEFFKNPTVIEEEIKINFSQPKDQEIIEFLVNEKNFNLDRVKSNIERAKKANLKVRQQSLDNFFGKKIISNKKDEIKLKKKK